MSLKNISSAVLLSIVLSGCATTAGNQDLLSKNYAAALYAVSFYESSASSFEISRFAEKIKESAGPQYQSIFFEDTKSLIKKKNKTRPFFKDMLIYISNAQKTGLVSGVQAQELKENVYRALAAQTILNPKLVNGELSAMYPDLQKYTGMAHEVEFNRAFNGELKDLEDYIAVYENIKTVDEAKAATLLPAIRTRVDIMSRFAGPGSWRDLSSIISIYSLTRDPQIEQSVRQFVSLADLSKAQLKTEVAAVLPGVAATVLAEREVLVKIVSDSNDPFIDELPQALEAADEWIVVDDEAKRSLKIARLRFTERAGSPMARTQTVGSPDFSTLLFIPKNASVLYDTVSSNYDLNWSMNVSDSAGKGSKIISGKKTVQKVECSNIRFKNVFGGEGPLNIVPSEIQSKCSSHSSVDFDAVRASAVKDIAGEIVQLLRKESSSAAPAKK